MKAPQDTLPFHPYYTIKDSVGIVRVLPDRVRVLRVLRANFFGDPDNFIPANPLQTPAEIVPEWYFLPFYAILRSVPNKLGGVLHDVRLDPGAVRAALARHLPGAQRPVPADLPRSCSGCWWSR